MVECDLVRSVRNGRCARLLALTLTVHHELHAGPPRKPNFALLAASPLPSVPLLWSRAEVALLEGTSLLPSGATAADAEAATRTVFETDVLPLMRELGDVYMPPAVRTQQHFAESLAWVVSRALLGRLRSSSTRCPRL